MFLHKSIAIQSNLLYLLYTGQRAEFLAILDSFTGITNATSTPLWARSQEVVRKGYVFTKNSQMTSIGAIFTSTCHTKQINPWPNSSARLCGDSQSVICLPREDGAI